MTTLADNINTAFKSIRNLTNWNTCYPVEDDEYQELRLLYSQVIPGSKKFTMYYPLLTGVIGSNVPIAYEFASDLTIYQLLQLINDFYMTPLDHEKVGEIIRGLDEEGIEGSGDWSEYDREDIEKKLESGEEITYLDFQNIYAYIEKFVSYEDGISFDYDMDAHL